ncbi:MAG: chorismate-binding protein [Acidimicrobiales bacterium]
MADHLVARTRRLPAATPDLLAVAGDRGVLFAREGLGFAGRGDARRVARGDAARALDQIEVDDEVERPGTGPVAFAALPFLPDAPAELVVPELLVGIDDDGAWATVVEPIAGAATDPVAAVEELLASARRPSPADGPSSFRVEASRDPADWLAAIASATGRIRDGHLDKVVLAREVVITADADLSVSTILLRLSQQYPGCFLYLVDGFCGATPELLVARHGDVVTAQPMAGTKPRRGDPEADARVVAELLASPTYRHEHQVTIDVVHDTSSGSRRTSTTSPSRRWCRWPTSSTSPRGWRAGSRTHRRRSWSWSRPSTPRPRCADDPERGARADRRARGPRPRALRRCGGLGRPPRQRRSPSASAARRSMAPRRVIAGNGMVGDSDPPTELIETRAKLQAMLSAIVRP